MAILINKPSDSISLTIKNSSGTSKLNISQKSNVVLKTVFGQGPKGEIGPQGIPGVSIVSITRTSGTGAPGTTDTYTVLYSNSSTSTFQVYNGANGTGDVNGPASSTNNAIVLFDGVTGKLIKNSGITLPSSALVGVSDTQTLSNKTIEFGNFTNGYVEESIVTSTNSSYTISLGNGSIQILTLNATTVAFTFPTPVQGQSFMLFLRQDATGGRNVTWPSSVKWPSGTNPTLTGQANKIDKFIFTAVDNLNWLGSIAGLNYTI